MLQSLRVKSSFGWAASIEPRFLRLSRLFWAKKVGWYLTKCQLIIPNIQKKGIGEGQRKQQDVESRRWMCWSWTEWMSGLIWCQKRGQKVMYNPEVINAFSFTSSLPSTVRFCFICSYLLAGDWWQNNKSMEPEGKAH